MPNWTGNKPVIRTKRIPKEHKWVRWRLTTVSGDGRFVAYVRKAKQAAVNLIPTVEADGGLALELQRTVNGIHWYTDKSLLVPLKRRPAVVSLEGMVVRYPMTPYRRELWDYREKDPLDALIEKEEMGLL